MSAPAGRVLGSAELRRRQLNQLGWAVHTVSLRDLYDAVKGGTLRLLVSKLLSSFDPGAARKASFGSSILQGQQAPRLTVLSGSEGFSQQSQKGGREFLEVLPELSDDEDETSQDSLNYSLKNHDPRNVLYDRARQAAAAVAAAKRKQQAPAEPE
eukprot:TRINITY_DN27104_c0_g1_i1.p1 TRINITY_DN27104_c0_g1~~TRINITY_DN27104_c0_g1_i1.p1  ORF type:complete len:155 (-),score=38.28 TRINITY_DN27104_c0_g1_i1:527-991(-)